MVKLLVFLFLSGWGGLANALEIIAPSEVKPGEVFFVEIKNSLSKDFMGGKFDGGELKFFQWGDKFGALVGVDAAVKEGEKDIIVEEFAPGDAPSMIWRYKVRVLKFNFPEVKVERKKPTPVDQIRISKEKDLFRQAMEKSEIYPLWQDWFSGPLANLAVSKGGEFGLIRKSILGATQHKAVDLRGAVGTSVLAGNAGRVVLAGDFLLEGRMVIIDHGLDLFSLYMHLDNIGVEVGDRVAKGTIIGGLGKSGRANGPHLHFEVRLGGQKVDPLEFLSLEEKVFPKKNDSASGKVGGASQSEKRDLLDLVRLGKEKLQQEPIYFFTTRVTRNILLGRGKNIKRSAKKMEVVSSKEILLAVVDSQKEMQVVRVEVATFGTAIQRLLNIIRVTPSECEVEKRGGGGVSTNLRVVCAGEEQKVVASAHILFADKSSSGKSASSGRKVIYVPYADNLVEELVVVLGRLYIEFKVKEVGRELKNLAVYSRAIPGRLVAEVFPEELPFNLSLIEHIDHNEFVARGPVYTGEKVLTQLALNKEDTFRYAKSSAAALCLMQIMPGTYREVRLQYPRAKLPISFEKGACDHIESIKTAYLVLDSKLASMPSAFRQKFLQEPEKYGIFLAAAYNGGSGRAAEWYQKFEPERLAKVLQDSFRESMPQKKGPKETWFFIKKYMEIAKEFIGQG